jgi:hypothetical protein
MSSRPESQATAGCTLLGGVVTPSKLGTPTPLQRLPSARGNLKYSASVLRSQIKATQSAALDSPAG